jgi:hypothetical protein
MVTGTISDKLDLIRTYDRDYPFQVGVNGVTNIVYYSSTTTNNTVVATTAITRIDYVIDDINYSTTFSNPFRGLDNPGNIGVTVFSTPYSGYDFEPEIVFPNIQNTFDIKEENKMGMVFPPKVINELFIERGNTAVFERYSRFSEINSLGTLINYRNGYYNIIQNI